MKKLLTLLLVLALSISVFAGCAPKANEPADDGETQEEGAPTESENPQTLIIGSTSAPRTLNPLYFPSRQDGIVTNLIFDNFVEPNEEGEIVGSLVDSIDISEDGLTYTFKLVEGVTWHDGEVFDGDDVVATLELLAHPSYTGGVDRTGDIVGVEEYAAAVEAGEEDASISGVVLSEDKMTVEITIKDVSAAFLPGLYIQILPEHKIVDFDIANLEEDPFNSNPVGTGPYVFEEWEVGTKISVSANENYFKGAPSIDNMIVKFGDAVALTTQLEAGEIDMLEVDKNGYTTFDGNADFITYTYPMSSVNYIGFRTAEGRAEDTASYRPVYDVEIRQALAYATNEATLVDAAYGVAGYVHDSIFPKGSIGDSPNDPAYEYNVEKAKELIEAAGYVMGTDGFYEKDGQVLEVELLYAESNTAVAEILKEQWKQAGVDANIKLLDFGALIDVLLRQSDADGNVKEDGSTYDEETLGTDANFDAYLLGFAQESDPNEYAQYFIDDNFWNFYHYQNEDVQAWFVQQAVQVEVADRSETLHKISEQISTDLPWYTYAGANEIIVATSNLTGFNPDSRGYTMNAYQWELN